MPTDGSLLGLGRVSIGVSFRLIRVRLGLVCGYMGLSVYQSIGTLGDTPLLSVPAFHQQD